MTTLIELLNIAHKEARENTAVEPDTVTKDKYRKILLRTFFNKARGDKYPLLADILNGDTLSTDDLMAISKDFDHMKMFLNLKKA